MRVFRIASLAAALAIATTACATTSTATMEWRNNGTPLYGQVVNIQRMVHEVHGDPGAGAVAGGVIGALLFRRAPIAGAIAGATIGAAASSGSAVTETFRVWVRFEDGSTRPFDYRDYAPVRPGQPVALTPNGLEPM